MPDKGKMREWLINKKSKKIKEFKYLENKNNIFRANKI